MKESQKQNIHLSDEAAGLKVKNKYYIFMVS